MFIWYTWIDLAQYSCRKLDFFLCHFILSNSSLYLNECMFESDFEIVKIVCYV